MLSLTIIGCILAAIALLLFIPVRLRFEYRGHVLKAKLGYLFISFDLLPEEDARKAAKKAERAAKKEYRKQKKEEGREPKESKAALDTVKTILTIMRSAGWGLKYICSHMVFYGVKIYISVSEPEAHRTAESYGKLCARLYPGIQAFGETFMLKDPDIIVIPDFLHGKSRYYIAFKVRILPIIVIISLVNMFTQYTKAVLEKKKEKRNHRNRRRNYEPATSGK